jgi:hypothetical protein
MVTLFVSLSEPESLYYHDPSRLKRGRQSRHEHCSQCLASSHAIGSHESQDKAMLESAGFSTSSLWSQESLGALCSIPQSPLRPVVGRGRLTVSESLALLRRTARGRPRPLQLHRTPDHASGEGCSQPSLEQPPLARQIQN